MWLKMEVHHVKHKMETNLFESEEMIVKLLSEIKSSITSIKIQDYDQIKTSSGILWNMASTSDEVRRKVREQDGLTLLSQALLMAFRTKPSNAASTKETIYKISGALASLSLSDENATLIGENHDIVPSLLNSLHTYTASDQENFSLLENILTLLNNLSVTGENRKQIYDLKGIPVLIKFLKQTNTPDSLKLAEKASNVLTNMAIDDEASNTIREEGGIEELVSLVSISNNGDEGHAGGEKKSYDVHNVRKRAAKTLWNLMISDVNLKKIEQIGGLKPLVSLLPSTDLEDLVQSQLKKKELEEDQVSDIDDEELEKEDIDDSAESPLADDDEEVVEEVMAIERTVKKIDNSQKESKQSTEPTVEFKKEQSDHVKNILKHWGSISEDESPLSRINSGANLFVPPPVNKEEPKKEEPVKKTVQISVSEVSTPEKPTKPAPVKEEPTTEKPKKQATVVIKKAPTVEVKVESPVKTIIETKKEEPIKEVKTPVEVTKPIEVKTPVKTPVQVTKPVEDKPIVEETKKEEPVEEVKTPVKPVVEETKTPAKEAAFTLPITSPIEEKTPGDEEFITTEYIESSSSEGDMTPSTAFEASTYIDVTPSNRMDSDEEEEEDITIQEDRDDMDILQNIGVDSYEYEEEEVPVPNVTPRTAAAKLLAATPSKCSSEITAAKRVEQIRFFFLTEKLYLNMLELIDSQLISNDQVKLWIGKEAHGEVFSDLDCLRMINRDMFVELETLYNKCNDDPKEIDNIPVGSLILKRTPTLRLYKTYCNNLERLLKTLSNIENNNDSYINHFERPFRNTKRNVEDITVWVILQQAVE